MFRNLVQIYTLLHLSKEILCQCDSGWSLREGHNDCYYVTSNENEATYTWHSARSWCMERGADLASISDIEEQNFITQKASEAGYTGYLWIGLNQLNDKTNNYSWSDGSQSTYSYYAAGQPVQSSGMQQCVYSRTTPNNGDCFDYEPGYSTVMGLLASPDDAQPPETYYFGERSEDVEGVDFCEEECRKVSQCHSYTFVSTLDPDPVWAGHCMGRDDTNDVEVQHIWSFSGSRIACLQKADTGTWYSSNCGLKYGKVCKKPSGSNSPLTTPSTQPVDSYCPRGFYSIRNGNKCYKVVTGAHNGLDIARTWDEAVAACRSEGGINPDLASVSTDLENAEILAALQGYVMGVWLGYFVHERTGAYVWADNAHPAYTNWAENQPGTGGTCAEMVVSPGTPGTWHSSVCTERRGYVCQTYKDPDNPINEPPLTTPVYCNEGWTPYWYACYRLETTPLSFDLAEENCVSLGGHLVSIHSEMENSAVAVMKPQNTLMRIGLHKLSGYYMWTDEWAVRYDNWDEGYPTDDLRGTCAVMLNHGGWQNEECDTNRAYMCKYSQGNSQTTPTHESGDCPGPEWFRWGSHCYWFENTTTLDWQQARESCINRSNINFTVDLTSLHSLQENEMIVNEMNNRSTSKDPAWIGLKKNNSESAFTWSDGTSMDYSLWYPGNPNSEDQLLCGSVVHDLYRGSWQTQECADTLRFVCKTQKTPTITTTTEGSNSASSSGCCNAWQVIGITLGALVIIAFVGFLGIFVYRYFIQPHKPGGTGLSVLDRVHFRNPLASKKKQDSQGISNQNYEDLHEDFTVNDLDVRRNTSDSPQQLDNPYYELGGVANVGGANGAPAGTAGNSQLSSGSSHVQNGTFFLDSDGY